MKSKRCKKKIIEELSKTPNIQLACTKIGITRQSFYRWRKEDEKFKKEVEEALIIGEEVLDDFFEGKHLQKAQEGFWPAIKFYLERRHPKFRTNYSQSKVSISSNTVTDIIKNKLESLRKRKN